MFMQPSPPHSARHALRGRVHAALSRARSRAASSVIALTSAAVLAGCALPTHPDSAAPPTDPYNPAATQLLDDTHWQLTAWTTGDGKSLPVPAAASAAQPITLNFSTAGGQRRVNGFSGCNRYMGTYDLSAGTLSFGALGGTRMACGTGPGSALEAPYLKGLGAIDKTGVQMNPPQQLQITLKSGDVLVFNQTTP